MKKLIYTIAIMAFSLTLNAQWVQLSNGMGDYKHVYSLAVSVSNIFAGTDSGIYRTDNNGLSWTKTAMYDIKIQSLAVSGNNLLAGTIITGIYLSNNNGISWAQSSLDNRNVQTILVNGSSVFAGTNFGVYISFNNGLSWTQTTLNFQNVLSLAALGNYIFAGTGGAGVYFSSDNGSTWSQSSMNNQFVYSLTAVSGKVFAGTLTNGVFMTSNNGANWSQTALNNKTITALASDGSSLFSGTDSSGIFFTANNGANWFPKNQGFNAVKKINSFLITAGFIFSGNTEQAVWRRSFSEIISVKKISENVPSAYALMQNFPNPFNPKTVIRFQVAGNSNVAVKIYDVMGREIQTLVNEILQAGTYESVWDAAAFPSGVYYYRLFTANTSLTKSMVVLK